MFITGRRLYTKKRHTHKQCSMNYCLLQSAYQSYLSVAGNSFWLTDYRDAMPKLQQQLTLCLKKVPTFKLSVSLSNLNLFSKFFHCWKACEICYKTTQHYPPHLSHAATLPWDIKHSDFLQNANIQQIWKNANKLHFQCTGFNSSTHVTVYAGVFMCFYPNLVIVAEYHVDCWQTLQRRLLWWISGATIDRKSKQVTEHSNTENFICNRYGENSLS